jgi:translation initiation factor 2 beta subunit (eIF-2beta)/eIF-5
MDEKDFINEFGDGHDPVDNEIMDKILKLTPYSDEAHVEFLKKAAEEDAMIEKEREHRRQMTLSRMAANAAEKIRKKRRPDTE